MDITTFKTQQIHKCTYIDNSYVQKKKKRYVLLNPQNRAYFLKKVCYKTTFGISPIKLSGLHLMRHDFFFFFTRFTLLRIWRVNNRVHQFHKKRSQDLCQFNIISGSIIIPFPVLCPGKGKQRHWEWYWSPSLFYLATVPQQLLFPVCSSTSCYNQWKKM